MGVLIILNLIVWIPAILVHCFAPDENITDLLGGIGSILLIMFIASLFSV